MRLRRLLTLLIICVGVAAVIGVAHWAYAAGDKPAEVAPPGAATPADPGALAPDNPVVSVVPGLTETEYEQDPFEQTRLRRSTNRVRSLLLIHANGEVETKQVQ